MLRREEKINREQLMRVTHGLIDFVLIVLTYQPSLHPQAPADPEALTDVHTPDQIFHQ